ncbi:CarD family transcriptional regulator [Neobacillus dielmonensis]|uniref:CarD family transcriptional regulator n=1 Tax=Neobacillus dielmonensis TaxID=1347369 RepID=UPI0005A6381C|nr:CarD family transcriptional regulator [Neobacillus dielmonensis]
MFNIGDIVIYSMHGVCQIEDICDKTINGVTRTYYVLHPLKDNGLTISTPVDNKTIAMQDIISISEAEQILDSFELPGVDWIDNANLREQTFTNIVNTRNRMEIARVLNTLMRKKHETELTGKKQSEHDRRLMSSIQGVLFKEMAIALNTTFDDIIQKATSKLSIQLTK